jgi:hypothetical protein
MTFNVKAASSETIECQLADMMVGIDLQPLYVIKDEVNESAMLEMLDCEELPLPLPVFDRRSSAPHSLLSLDGIMLRERLNSLDLENAMLRERSNSLDLESAEGGPDIPLHSAVHRSKSLPNFHHSRSLHNRRVGCSLSNPSECGSGKEKYLLHARAQEFEQLLADL